MSFTYREKARSPAADAAGTAPPSSEAVQPKRALADLSYEEQVAAVRPPPPVQLSGGTTASPGEVHTVAAEGLSGSGSALPHLDQLQESFGHHDVSGVRAHVGGAAQTATQKLGAEAYARGDAVAFKGSPDLRTAAHEAAHVVQQRAGVSLPSGVGQPGDAYEKHAEHVADTVVQGKSAESLLDAYARGTASTDVQAKAVQKAAAVPANIQGWLNDPKTHPLYRSSFVPKVATSNVPQADADAIWDAAVHGIYEQDPGTRQRYFATLATKVRGYLTPAAGARTPSLYSGPGARPEANKNYGILEETDGAKIFDQIKFGRFDAEWGSNAPGKGEFRQLWITLSTNFAQQLGGEVHAHFAIWDPNSIMVKNELKALSDNSITPIFHAVCTYPHWKTSDGSRVTIQETGQLTATGDLAPGNMPLASKAEAEAALTAWDSKPNAQKQAQWASVRGVGRSGGTP